MYCQLNKFVQGSGKKHHPSTFIVNLRSRPGRQRNTARLNTVTPTPHAETLKLRIWLKG